MIGLDTNVLVRFIMQDDVRQSEKANRLMASLSDAEPGYVTTVSVIELVWVLSASYDLTRVQVGQALQALLQSRQLVVERSELVIRALRVYSSTKADFADCLIERSAAAAGCEVTKTFDLGAVKHAGMSLLA